MMANEVISDSEEEILVYAEFADSVNIEKYNSIHILGVDTKSPIIQMDETFFTGSYENPLGTYIFFEEDHSPQSMDPVFDKIPDKNVKYVCKTRKVIKVEHGYITPKDSTEEEDCEETPVKISKREAMEALETLHKYFEMSNIF